jgi:3-isopropylmalate/(R)-2-methylmalate dehydratase small subunit
MKPLRHVEGRVAVLDRADVDTDQIMPKQFLKRIERTGWAEYLFYDWMKDPEFELNNPAYAGAKVLLAGRNFGCGSSREHAPWALQQHGFDVIIAPSFADIFRSNCSKTGILLIELPEAQVKELMAKVSKERGGQMEVDLERRTITAPDGETIPFEIDDFARHKLLEGLDDIGLTLVHEDAIAAYEAKRGPWPIDTTALTGLTRL